MNSSACKPQDGGLTIFFTGLPGSGKSTTASLLRAKLSEATSRCVTLLDSDAIRQTVSRDLGFSRADRNENIRRLGSAAAGLNKTGGIVVCACIAPYDSARKFVRQMVSTVGTFFLVHLSTPLRVCEERDRRGLYERARAGKLQHFTGVSDPYEPPDDADLVIDTTNISPEETADLIIKRLPLELTPASSATR